MRTLVYAVIAYFARDNTVHAHTRTRVKLIQSHTRSFAETQMHGDAVNSLNSVNSLNWVNTLITLITRTHAIIYRHTRTLAHA